MIFQISPKLCVVTVSSDTSLLSVISHADRTPWPMANFPAVSDVAETGEKESSKSRV